MSLARRTVEEYTALLAKAFNGAIEVDGQRIVAHPSGTLLTRPAGRMARGTVAPPAAPMMPMMPVMPVMPVELTADGDNDWSDV